MRAGVALALAGAVAGCGQVNRAAEDTSHAANAVVAAADRMADSLDDVDALSHRGERIAGRTAAVVVPAGSAIVTDRWLGHWRGVEGTGLEIAKDRVRGRGHYRLTMRYTLDDAGVFDGVADGEAIRFTRPDGAHELYAATGEETGLKWLAGKRDCLMVAKGEGYCRD